MRDFLVILKEHNQSKYMINRLALYELKNSYSSAFLGTLWIIINPVIQIGVYWLVFGLGIRHGAPVNGVPYFVWLVAGIIPWFFISQSIIQGSNAMYARFATVSKMNFPLSIIPTYVIFSQFYSHLIIMVIVTVILLIYVGVLKLTVLAIFYFLFSALCFLVALSFITSTLSTITRDIHLLISSIVRLLFYLTPVLWEPSGELPTFFMVMFKLNPFYYIVEGYRAALLGGDLSFIFSYQTIYFWNFTILLMIIGASIHIKFRKQFADYI